MSPESLMGNLQGYKSDIWALGVLLYELHMNKEPFPGKSSTDMLQMISTRPIEFSSQNFNKDGMNLVKGLLKYKELKRISVEKILNSKFLKKLTKEYFEKQTIPRTTEPIKKLGNISLNYLKRVDHKLSPIYSNPKPIHNDVMNSNEIPIKVSPVQISKNWSSNDTSGDFKVSSSSQSFRYLNMKNINKNIIPNTINSKSKFIKYFN